jgi:WD40 repeat protein
MARVVFAACAVLLASALARAADPKPLWELQASTERGTAPAWLAYSPNGKAVVAVTVRETGAAPPQYSYHLRVWDAETRKERFNADLGTGKAYHWGDDLAAFPTDDTVMTGGQTVMVRNLENGNQTASNPTGGLGDHSVWAVPDLKESFYLRRDPQRYDLPPELFFRSQNNYNQFSEFGGPRGRYRSETGTVQTTLTPPRDGLRTEGVILNPGRTRLVAAFRDDSGVSRPRHTLAMYAIKTMDDFELEPVAEAVNPHAGSVTALAFARNGRILATGAEDGSVSLWDTSAVGNQWKPRATLAGVCDHRVYAMAFNYDWRILAAVTWDKSKPNLLLIDVDTGKLIRSMKLERQLTAVAWHPDSGTLLTTGASGKIQAWDVAALLK